MGAYYKTTIQFFSKWELFGMETKETENAAFEYGKITTVSLLGWQIIKIQNTTSNPANTPEPTSERILPVKKIQLMEENFDEAGMYVKELLTRLPSDLSVIMLNTFNEFYRSPVFIQPHPDRPVQPSEKRESIERIKSLYYRDIIGINNKFRSLLSQRSYTRPEVLKEKVVESWDIKIEEL